MYCQKGNQKVLSIVALLVTVAVSLTSHVFAATRFKTIHAFHVRDGAGAYGQLISDSKGTLYGTTLFGGANNQGTAFQLTLHSNGEWTYSVLYDFCSETNCVDGSQPIAGLVLDQHGSLYGATSVGGIYNEGAVFKLAPNGDGMWAEQVLHSFNFSDGAHPLSSLVLDQAGNLYGVTHSGGAGGNGTAFELVPNQNGTWSETVIYAFCSQTNCVDGDSPYGSLIFDQTGNLFGTTQLGGSASCFGGCGVVFELTPEGGGTWKELVLHEFRGGKDGMDPGGGLTFDGVGNLFATTARGGVHGRGTIFELTPKQPGEWAEKILYSFTGGKDGDLPTAGVTLDGGNLFGTTAMGGDFRGCSGGCGVVFRLATKADDNWTETVLHRFRNRPGSNPASGVTFDAAGNLFGCTAGTNAFGSVYVIFP